MNNLQCDWPPVYFLIFSKGVFDPLVYYSHLTGLILCIALAVLIVIKKPRLLVTNLLLLFTISIGFWLFADSILWASNSPQQIMFFWSTLILIEPFIYALALYFVYVFYGNKDILTKKKILIFCPLFVTILLTPTRFALLGFDMTNCDRAVIEGPLVNYNYILEIIYLIWILILTITIRKKIPKNEIMQKLPVSFGMILFLSLFLLGNVIGSFFYFNSDAFTALNSWAIGQYGLFGIPIFIGFLLYSIVKFNLFSIKLVGVEVLVFAIIFLVASQYFFIVLNTLSVVMLTLTLILVCIGGYFLIQNARRLRYLDKQKSEFISIATHHIATPLTVVKGYLELIQDGRYGKMPDEMKKTINTIEKSTDSSISKIRAFLKTQKTIDEHTANLDELGDIIKKS